MKHSSLKVLHIIDSGGLYGAEMMLLNLALEQQRMGITPCIASIGDKYIDEKPIETKAIKYGIHVKKFRMSPGPNLLGANSILNYSRENRFSLLHAHGYKGNILFGFLPLTLRWLPIISTLHGYTSMGSGLSKMRLYERLDAMALSRMDAVVLVNKAMLNHPNLKNVKRRNIHIIDNGIPAMEAGKSSNLCEKIISFCDHPCVIGAIGRLSDEKGFHILLEAFALVVNRGMQSRLIIIGDGHLRQELINTVHRLGLEGNVMIPGFLENAAEYIPFFKILVIPSFTEGLPITLLEAMRAGVPVIASEVGGIPNVIKHGYSGITVTPGDRGELQKSIERLYADETLRLQFSRVAKNQYFKNYTSRKMAFSYLQLYRQITGIFGN